MIPLQRVFFADFYGSDEAPTSESKPEKFSFRQDEQSEPDTGKKRKAGRLQEDESSVVNTCYEDNSNDCSEERRQTGNLCYVIF